MRITSIVLLILFLREASCGMSWLSGGLIAWSGGGGNRTACNSLRGITKKQLRYCRNNPDVVPSIAVGAFDAYNECQYQFSKRRWNCTLLESVEGGGKGLEAGTREAAFVHAISSAGVAYRVTRDCSKGLSEKCGCDHSGTRRNQLQQRDITAVRKGFEFEGCSDNIQYGLAVSREFVDASEKLKNKSEQSTLNLHNNRAGREVIERSVRRECKCHGMSGSCDVKTCWMSMPQFREIGEIMREKFDGASEVMVMKQKMIMKHNHLKRHTHADLVYMKPSPDYCVTDMAKGILGTKGRQCNEKSMAMDGCQLMCCGRGHKAIVKRTEEKCNCKFIYCCRVECQTCVKEEIKHICL